MSCVAAPWSHTTPARLSSAWPSSCHSRCTRFRLCVGLCSVASDAAIGTPPSAAPVEYWPEPPGRRSQQSSRHGSRRSSPHHSSPQHSSPHMSPMLLPASALGASYPRQYSNAPGDAHAMAVETDEPDDQVRPRQALPARATGAAVSHVMARPPSVGFRICVICLQRLLLSGTRGSVARRPRTTRQHMMKMSPTGPRTALLLASAANRPVAHTPARLAASPHRSDATQAQVP